MAGNPDFFKQASQASISMGERATQSDFELLIEGLEEYAPLIRTAQTPMVSRGEPVEDQGAYGQMFKQYGPVKKDGEMTFTIVELKSGRMEDAIYNIIENGVYVKAWIRHKGEDYAEKGYKMEHCILSMEAGDLDTTATTSVVNRSITMTYSWCERI